MQFDKSPLELSLQFRFFRPPPPHADSTRSKIERLEDSTAELRAESTFLSESVPVEPNRRALFPCNRCDRLRTPSVNPLLRLREFRRALNDRGACEALGAKARTDRFL